MESPLGPTLSHLCPRRPTGLRESHKDHQPQYDAAAHHPCFIIDKPDITFPVTLYIEHKHGVSGIGGFVIAKVLEGMFNQSLRKLYGQAVPCPTAKVYL